MIEDRHQGPGRWGLNMDRPPKYLRERLEWFGYVIVTEARVDSGPTMKRFQPKDRGRAHQILKRTSHITVGVDPL